MNLVVLTDVDIEIERLSEPYRSDARQMVEALLESTFPAHLTASVGTAGVWRQDSGDGCVWVKFAVVDEETVVVFEVGMAS
jgi:hypothetical protein